MAETDAPASHPAPKEVTIPGTKKKVPRTAAIAGVAVVGVFAIMWWRNRSKGAAGATVTDSAGNVCAAINPATGFCPGSTQDVAALQGAAGSTTGSGSGSGGTVFGTDVGTQVQTGPPFTSNAAWTQYVSAYLIGTVNEDPQTVTDALGAYVEGAPVTTAQERIVRDAISVGGTPPTPGPNGFPPSINVQGTTNNGHVKIPNVVGMAAGEAHNVLTAAGLKPSDPNSNRKDEPELKVTRETPAAGTTVASGSTVTITVAAPPKPPVPHGDVTVPRVTGERAQAAEEALADAGLTYRTSPHADPRHEYVVASQTPGAGKRVSRGSNVDIGLRKIK